MGFERTAPTVLAVCLAATLASPPARADRASDAAAAQSLYDDGRKLMAEQKYAEACPKLEASQRLDPGTGTQFHLADCYEHVGRTASAWAMFLEVAASAKAHGKTDQEQIARDRANALAPKLSRLTVKLDDGVSTDGLVVKRGNVPVDSGLFGTPVAVDPGKYTVSASAPGKQPYSTDVNVGANADSKTVLIPALADAAAGAPAGSPEGGSTDMGAAASGSADTGAVSPSGGNGMRIGSYVALGVGVVGLGVGTVFGLKSKSKRSDADKLADECGSGCLASDPRAAQIASLDDDARSAKTLATVGFIVGGVGIATGVTLFVLSGKKKSETAKAHVEPWLGLGSAGVSGSF